MFVGNYPLVASVELNGHRQKKKKEKKTGKQCLAVFGGNHEFSVYPRVNR